MKKFFKRSLTIFFVLILVAVIGYAWLAFPIISGYGAKNLASAVYVQHRDPALVIEEELSALPFLLATYKVHREDSSVTGSVWGMAKQKAIYRKGLGCTLIRDLSEQAVRNQPMQQLLYVDSLKLRAWPYGELLRDSAPSAVNKPVLQGAINNAFHATATNGKPAKTRAVLVVYDGQIVGEQYAPGFNKDVVMLGWSVSKSLTAALIGILVKDGKLNVDAPAPVPEWKNKDKSAVTLKHLLQQTTGLGFTENYSMPSSVTNMLFKKGDMAAYTANHSLTHKPGTVFNYSSGNSNVLSRIIRHTVGKQDYAAFPHAALFHKINAPSFLLEPDASGTYVGSSYSYATARDFARFGLLYLNDGVWNGERILPEGWVQQTVQPSTADALKHYGYQFWLNGWDEDDSSKRRYPSAPPDLFSADGFGGQNIYIIPSRKLVIVRLGLYNLDEDKLLKEVLAAFPK